ncbi:hypothetical protein [Streptomyces axinellae]|uniref:hypothetical protein n=1 Tax=Streptomyces axinellae TaxID=552788 RepID=UPI0031CF6582
MRERAPEHQPDAARAPHPASVQERGSFCWASCGCGWRGPGRRARDRARADAREHEATAPSAPAAPPHEAPPPPGGPAGAEQRYEQR